MVIYCVCYPMYHLYDHVLVLYTHEPHHAHTHTHMNHTHAHTHMNTHTHTSLQQSRQALQRYLFYCNRYMNHLKSSKMESKLYSMAHTKMKELQDHDMSWIEVRRERGREVGGGERERAPINSLLQCRGSSSSLDPSPHTQNHNAKTHNSVNP